MPELHYRYVPDFVNWLDWCFHAYWPGLLLSILIACAHYYTAMPNHFPWYSAFSTTPVLIGAAWWVIACAMHNGYGIG